MLLIVSHHYVIHSNFDFSNMILFNKIYLRVLLAGGQIGVNLFVLISAYFLSRSTINIKKIIRLELQVIFYSIFIGLIFYFFQPHNVSLKSLIKSFFPLLGMQYWFYKVYLMLFILIPFLNCFSNVLDKKNYQKLLVILFTILSVISSFYGYWEENIFSFLGWFIFIYFCAAYIRIYNEDFLRNRGFYFIIAFGVYLLYLSIYIFFNMKLHFISANNVFVFLISFCIFLGFLNFDIGSIRIVNIIASATFGVYLIHDNMFLRKFLWHDFFKNSSYQSSHLLVLHSVITIFSLYILCTLIDLLRHFIFDRLLFNFWERKR